MKLLSTLIAILLAGIIVVLAMRVKTLERHVEVLKCHLELEKTKQNEPLPKCLKIVGIDV